MSEQDDRSPEPEDDDRKRDTGDIKPPTREDDEPPATGATQRGTGDIKPPTE